MHEKEYIKKCLADIEHTLQWASREKWVYEDFRQLQDLIFDASSIQLSVHTLERLFGKLKTQDNYNPQLDTKNALAIFLGYKSWSHYKAENKVTTSEGQPSGIPLGIENKAFIPGDAPTTNETSRVIPAPVVKEPVQTQKWRFYAITFLLIACCGGAVFYYLFSHPAATTAPAIRFTVANPYGRVPHTAKFICESPKATSNPLRVNFGDGVDWNVKETQPTFFKTYMLPGIYDVSLKQDSHTVATTHVFIDTQGWQGYIYKTYEDNKTRHLLPANLLRSPGRLYTSPVLIPDSLKKGIYFVEYNLVRDFGVDGDYVTFDTRFRSNVANGGDLCNDMWFKLVGTQGMLKMHFLVTGCSGYIQMIFGDQQLDGRIQDLSTFTRDFSDWKTARMKVVGKQVSIYFDDKLIFQTSYRKPIGNLMAMSITSKGSGETQYVKLYDRTGKMAFGEDFN